jgi:hypothetical protein
LEDVSTVARKFSFQRVLPAFSRPDVTMTDVRPSIHRRRWRSKSAVLPLLGSVLLGCGGDATSPGLTPANAYWDLQLNEHAVALALTPGYDTVQLHAIPLNAAGQSLSNVGTTSYAATDSSIRVSTTGLVTAHYVTEADKMTSVVASLRDEAQGITHYDTVFFVVTATPDTNIAALSMQPAPSDSAKRAIVDVQGFSGFTWPAIITHTAGDTVCSTSQCTLPIKYTSSNADVATMSTGVFGVSVALGPNFATVSPVDVGHTYFKASILAYGKQLRDSVDFLITPSLSWFVLMGRDASGAAALGHIPTTVTLGVGAVVNFVNSFDFIGPLPPLYVNDLGPVTITFDGPAVVDSAAGFFGPAGSGDVTFSCDSAANPSCTSPNEMSKARRFTTPGTYTVHYSLQPSKTYYIKIE